MCGALGGAGLDLSVVEVASAPWVKLGRGAGAQLSGGVAGVDDDDGESVRDGELGSDAESVKIGEASKVWIAVVEKRL